MVSKKGKNQKHVDHDQKKTSEVAKDKATLSDVFLDELKGAFTKFDALSEGKRTEVYGKEKYIDQFWVYFKKEHPNLLDKIDKKDLPIYMQMLEDTGFSFTRILDEKENKKLSAEFSSDTTEKQVMEKSLSGLKEFCENDAHGISPTVFSSFASAVGFNPTTCQIYDTTSKLKTIDNLYPLWNSFLDKEKITISETAQKKAAQILLPDYNPTERIMVEVALNKIRKQLTGKLKTDFDERFPIPINIFSPFQDIISFRNEWLSFMEEHASSIDEKLAKKLDAIMVTNGDIQKVILESGRSFDDTKGFSEWEQYFRRIFNKLATRQLFEEVSKKEKTIDHYIEAMGKTFKEFPPYANEILNIYPFNAKEIAGIDPSYAADSQNIDMQISDINAQYPNVTDQERKELRIKVKALKEEKEHRKWQAYIAFLRTKDTILADVFVQLVASKFDFSALSQDQQQILVTTLMKNKLEDTIKNKVPELLSVTEEDLTQFVNDLFDLKKMNIIIPTRTGPVPLSFVKKEFMSSTRQKLPSIDDLEGEIKNLPLNFVTQLTDGNAAFFENSPIFSSIYTPFVAKNGEFRLNDAYRVKIQKNGKTVQGYLSSYCPIDEKYNDADYNGKEMFLYSEPITAPNQERKLVTWEGTDDGTPVVIKEDEQSQCTIDVLDKKINLNGDALGALLFGYVLGQESMAQTMSPKKEEELGQKLGDLTVYKEKEEPEDIEQQPIMDASETTSEISEKQKFFNERKQLKGYGFPEPQYNVKGKENYGFVKGTRLLIPFAESEVEPVQTGGKAWLQMEIVDIDEKKGTFTTKIHGGELGLGKYEGEKKEMPINAESMATIKRIFGDSVYKFSDKSKHSWDEQMNMMNGPVTKELEKTFGSLQLNGDGFAFTLGDQKGQKVTHFGRYESGIGERHDQELGTSVLYKIKHNSNKTFTVTGEVNTQDKTTRYHSRDMDYATFMIFVKEKGLQPKSEKQAERMKQKPLGEDQETETTVRGFSLNNVFGFFKNSFSKLKDNIKKYDDEKTEDLTDVLTDEGRLYSKLGSLLPFDRMASGFEIMGAEHFSERDSRVWKKVEKRKKFYEDADFTMIYGKYIYPMLKGEITITPHYKAAAMLLAMISKGKGPYNRNTELTATGTWVNILMGPAHQARYLDMREKLVREMEQGSATYGSIWTDNKKNEILELEMKYIVHVMDARQLQINDNDATKYYFYGKYSKTFIDELDKGYTGFFSQATVDEGFGKNKAASFEFARGEFFRLLGDRPQQAIPFLKVMATKAVSNSQWKTFEMAVMTGMLSGVFLTMTMSETQGMIKNICRTRGFVPGIWVKDIKQQTKLQRMLDIFSGNAFSNMTYGSQKKKYNANSFDYRNISGGARDFSAGLQTRMLKDNNLDHLSDFFKLKGKDAKGQKTLLDIYTDPKTPAADKALLQEFLNNSNEKNEDLDVDVRNNRYALRGSILTKSQSVVHQMMKFDNNGFAGKDGDEIQAMQGFFVDMQKDIPTTKLDSTDQVKFFMDKFFNWFDEKGFSLNNKTELVKRLKRCQLNAGKKEVNDVLYYSVVGQICHSLGRVQIPDEFHDALLARKDFFQNNLDTILQPNILVNSFGSPSYKNDYDKYKPQLEPWEGCVNLLDRELKQAHMYTLPPDERKFVNQNLTKLKSNKNFLNAELYDLASRLYTDCGVDNRFKSSVGDAVASTTSTSSSISSTLNSVPQKVTGAKIKNTQVVDKVKAILEGKPIVTPGDEYIPEEENDFNMYDN